MISNKIRLSNVLYFTFYIFFLTSTFVTGKSQVPIWVKEFGSRTFSKDGIEGIGFATYEPNKRDSYRIARDNAYNDAIKNLALKLKTEIKGTVERQIRSQLEIVGKKHKEESQEVLDSITQVMFDTVLGRKMFEEYQDKKNKRWWVFVWMTKEDVDKTIAEELLKQETKNRSIMKSCLELSKSVQQYLFPQEGKERVLTAISIYENILSQLTEIKGFVIENGIDNVSLKIEAENNLKLLLNSIKISSEKESSFDVEINQVLDIVLPIKVQTNFKNKVLDIESFPLKLKLVKGSGDIDLNIKTDTTGVAKPKIYKLSERENTIEVVPDIDELMKVSERFKDMVNLRLYYYVTAKKLRELKKVYVEISANSEDNDATVINTELISKLKKEGFNIVERKDLADFVLTGEFSVEYLGNKITLPEGKVIDFGEMYSGTINVELKDVKKNEVALSKNFVGIKGFGKTKKESENNTIKKLGSAVADYIISNW